MKFTVFELLWVWIVLNTPEMSSSLQNEDFDVLQGLLDLRNSIFHILTNPALDNSLAAILDTRAVIAEIPPSGFFIPRGSKSQNKCQNEGHKKSPRAPKGRPRTSLRAHYIKAGVPKVVDIDPQGSMGASKGSMNMQGVERGSMNN